jgi:hypothetical protein
MLSMGFELFYSDGGTDGHEEAKSRFSQLIWELSLKKKFPRNVYLQEIPNVHLSNREPSDKNMAFFTLHGNHWSSENTRLLGYGAV